LMWGRRNVSIPKGKYSNIEVCLCDMIQAFTKPYIN
jgi:hypothetical protein